MRAATAALMFIALTACTGTADLRKKADPSNDVSDEMAIALPVDYETAYRRLADRYAKYFEFDGTVYSNYARATSGHPSAGYHWVVDLKPGKNGGTRATITTFTARASAETIANTLRGNH